VFQRNLEVCQLAVGQLPEELVDGRQQAVGDFRLFQSGLRDDFDVTVGFQVGVERADVVLVKSD
jgi:hypothetical protein